MFPEKAGTSPSLCHNASTFRCCAFCWSSTFITQRTLEMNLLLSARNSSLLKNRGETVYFCTFSFGSAFYEKFFSLRLRLFDSVFPFLNLEIDKFSLELHLISRIDKILILHTRSTSNFVKNHGSQQIRQTTQNVLWFCIDAARSILFFHMSPPC